MWQCRVRFPKLLAWQNSLDPIPSAHLSMPSRPTAPAPAGSRSASPAGRPASRITSTSPRARRGPSPPLWLSAGTSGLNHFNAGGAAPPYRRDVTPPAAIAGPLRAAPWAPGGVAPRGSCYRYLGTGVPFRFDGEGVWPSAIWDVCLCRLECEHRSTRSLIAPFDGGCRLAEAD
jgi:hypothetical protein